MTSEVWTDLNEYTSQCSYNSSRYTLRLLDKDGLYVSLHYLSERNVMNKDDSRDYFEAGPFRGRMLERLAAKLTISYRAIYWESS